MSIKGNVKWFNSAKGFGFLVCNEVEQDVFVHYSAIDMSGFKTLKEGDEVEFELVDHQKGPQACNVKKVN